MSVKIGEASPSGRGHRREATTDAAPSSGGDYLRKRHMSEGARRRQIAGITRLVTDDELDDRNARVWRNVRGACLTAIGEPPDAAVSPRSRSKRELRKLRAVGAAYKICRHRYGIPMARLADLGGVTPQRVGDWVQSDHEDVLSTVIAWDAAGGPSGALLVDLALVQVTQEAAQALARAARESGESPVVLASAALLAALTRARA